MEVGLAGDGAGMGIKIVPAMGDGAGVDFVLNPPHPRPPRPAPSPFSPPHPHSPRFIPAMGDGVNLDLFASLGDNINLGEIFMFFVWIFFVMTSIFSDYIGYFSHKVFFSIVNFNYSVYMANVC